MDQSGGASDRGAGRYLAELNDDEQDGPLAHLVRACRQLGKHFGCSPYEFLNKPAIEIWALYEGVTDDLRQQRRDD